MNADEAQTQELQELLGRLSAGDRSILSAMLETPDSQIATVRNTPNDVLWSRLVELGFALPMKLDLDLPPALEHIQPRSFALTAMGRTKMAQLLQKLPS